MMSFDELAAHYGHDVEVVLYGRNINTDPDAEPDVAHAEHVAVECRDCGVELLTIDK
jgi:hypothetical protein